MEWYHWEGCSRQRAIDKALIELHEEEINLSLGQTQLRAAIEGLVGCYYNLVEKYSITSMQDAMSEGWELLTAKLAGGGVSSRRERFIEFGGPNGGNGEVEYNIATSVGRVLTSKEGNFIIVDDH
ncbi:Uncharacterized protein BM_BM9469 [Brugia malayi]|uniref:Uncharacterized protein n=1 Tax=Brugia malayi TaxID=6279 RepID=A0A4E9FYV1_BRUMA|nr:Uncharacterized protein BM_BM9469 [Brugia malayi]VIO99650.1 Uncharacterized protein BM_BM9469 [Brugia malayi]